MTTQAIHLDRQAVLLSELERSFPTNVFIMMRYRNTDQFEKIETTLRQSLAKFGLTARLAKDAALVDDLWENIQIYMKHSRFGIAVFEEIDERVFTPNISLELGYMYALNRRCLLLKDSRMPSLPIDTGGKIYKDFDIHKISKSLSKQIHIWCKKDLGLSESLSTQSTQTSGVVNFDGDAEDPEFRGWGVYDTTLLFEKHIQLVPIPSVGERPGQSYAMQISASSSESVGINKKIETLVGKAHFAFKAAASSAEIINLFFAMIPMRKDGTGQRLLEVGGDRQDDPRNAYSPYRERYYVPHSHIGDDVWHHAEINFDFRKVPNAAYSIFAARINEGCTAPGAGKLLVRSVKIISYEQDSHSLL